VSFQVEPTPEEIAKLKSVMGGRSITLNTEDSEDMLRKHYGHDFDGAHNDGDWKTWDPTEKAGYKPKPKLLLPHIKNQHDPSWKDYITPENLDKDFYIVGGGASALKHGKHLDGQIVYGINWTVKWFMPTFLQIMDPSPWTECVETASARWIEPTTQLVTTRWLWHSKLGRPKGPLLMNVVHPSRKKNRESACFAETPDETVWWAPNSLYLALNVAHWFRPRRIVLLGFDWGGHHIFGDGRSHGCRGVYKEKDGLHERLMYVRDELEARGNIIRHVGPSKLDLFKQVETVEEAIK
jgi:hypothetical protein